MNLWTYLENTPQPTEPSPAEATAMERSFQRRVDYVRGLDGVYRGPDSTLKESRTEFIPVTQTLGRIYPSSGQDR
jgi:hypothetical protein